MRILQWNGILLFTLPFFLQCYKPQLGSFKIVCELQLINATDLHYRYTSK